MYDKEFYRKNNIYNTFSSYEKEKIIEFALKRLKENNINRERGELIEYCPNKDILSAYFVNFSSYAANDYWDIVEPLNQPENLKRNKGFIYFVVSTQHDFCKIGYSKNPEIRIKAIETTCPFDIEVKKIIEGGVGVERKYHKMFSDYKIKNEWFVISGKLKEFLEL